MLSAQTAPDMKASGTRKLSATREVWVVKDAADAVKSFIAKAEGLEQLDKLNSQLAAVQTGLNDFRRYLDLPPKPSSDGWRSIDNKAANSTP